MGQVDEERLVFVFLHKIDRFLCAAPGYGALVNGQLNDLLILEERRLPFREGRFGVVPENVHSLPTTLWLTLVVGVIHVIGIRNAKISIEAVGCRQYLLVMPKMPLAKTGGGIA